ncbi:MAG TPA: AAA family ATPase [Bacillota bacterium]|nr:AAA family ATPase [Bacillota bacterium]
MRAFTKEISELLPTSQLPELHARLRHTLDQCGLMLITGEPGVGKTAAVRSFCQGLDPTTCAPLYLADPTLSPRALYRLLADQLGLEAPWSASECGRLVRSALLARRQAGAVPLLLLDEADELPLATLGELRVLQNADMDNRSPAAIVLIGAPLLRQRLRLVTLAALAQRVTTSYHLVGLTAAETAAYIDLQLGLDGTPAITFTPAAIDDVFHLTRGVPRLINRLCQTAILAASGGDPPLVEPRTVKAAAIDCGLA